MMTPKRRSAHMQTLLFFRKALKDLSIYRTVLITVCNLNVFYERFMPKMD